MWGAWGRSSPLSRARANKGQTDRNVLLCQAKPARPKSPGVLFLELIVVCFLSSFAYLYVPLQALLRQEEPGADRQSESGVVLVNLVNTPVVPGGGSWDLKGIDLPPPRCVLVPFVVFCVVCRRKERIQAK